MRDLERVKGSTRSLLPVSAAIALWVTCAGVVRVQGNAAAAEEATVPFKHLSPGVRDPAATPVVATTIDDVGGTAGIAPGKSPCVCGLSEEDSGTGGCNAELHYESGSQEIEAL